MIKRPTIHQVLAKQAIATGHDRPVRIPFRVSSGPEGLVEEQVLLDWLEQCIRREFEPGASETSPSVVDSGKGRVNG